MYGTLLVCEGRGILGRGGGVEDTIGLPQTALLCQLLAVKQASGQCCSLYAIAEDQGLP